LVPLVIFMYDARSHIHEIGLYILSTETNIHISGDFGVHDLLTP